ncbi:MAG: hypothetical protein FGM46_00690 [Ferruginibacter sp.]|nr:hypothetical protein [Ferruginibacter sp.]
MRNFKRGLFLILILVSLNLPGYSQIILDEVQLVYEIQTVENIKGISSANKSKDQLTVFLKGNRSRTEMKSILGSEINIYDNVKKQGVILKDFSGQKLLIKMDELAWRNRNSFMSNIRFEVTNQSKFINGFHSTKAEAIDNPYISEVYFLKDTLLENSNYYNALTNLKGIPVSYTISSSGFTFTYTLKSILKEGVSNNMFDIPKTGFRNVTYEEIKKIKEE